MHVHRPQIAHVLDAPDLFQQLFARKDPPPVFHQKAQNVELFGGEIDRLAIERDGEICGVDLQAAAFQLGGLLFHGGLGPPGAAQNGLDARLDLQNIEGLGHVVVGAVFQAEDLVHILALGGEHDNGHIGVFADAGAHFHAAQLGEHDVEQDQVIIAAFGLFDGPLRRRAPRPPRSRRVRAQSEAP